MRGDLSGYYAVNARARGMAAKLLTPEKWRALLHAGNIADIARELQNTPYHEQVSPLGERQGARDLQRTARQDLVSSYLRVLQFMPQPGRKTIAQMMKRLTLEEIKILLRAKVAGADEATTRELLLPLTGPAAIPIADLLAATNVEEMASILNNTVFGRAISSALDRFRSEGQLFPVEVALDLWYYRSLWRTTEDLAARDRSQAQRLLGARIDAANIAWAFRYRHNYGLSEEEIINYTLPFGYRVTDAILRSIATGAAPRQILAQLDIPFPTGTHELPLTALEVILQRWVLQLARSALTGYPFHIGTPIAFLLLKDAEVGDLIKVTAGKVEGLSTDEIASLLVSVEAEGAH